MMKKEREKLQFSFDIEHVKYTGGREAAQGDWD